MPDRRRRLEHPPGSGQYIEGDEVEISEVVERGTDVKLADGTFLKMKLNVIRAIRLSDQWDADGNPSYAIVSNNIINVIDTPPELRRG